MQGHLSDCKKFPESWDAAKEAVRADQDQNASRVGKSKKPECPEDGEQGQVENLQELRKVRNQKHAESESS